MILVLAAHAGGGEELARVLRLLGWDVARSPLAELDDALARAGGGDGDWIDPDALERARPSLPPALVERARAAVREARSIAFQDPRLCLTLPLWRSLGLDALHVIVHRHPHAAARQLLAERGIPISVGLALWQLHMLSALHATRDARRVHFDHATLVRDPARVARELHHALEGRGTDLGRLGEIAALARDDVHDVGLDALLTRAQLDLYEPLREGRWPAIDRDAPYALLSKDVLVLHRTSVSRDASAPDRASTLATQLGRARATAWHLELRARQATEHLERAETERARARRELLDVRATLERERSARANAARAVQRPPIPAIGSPEERLRTAGTLLDAFASHLYATWTAEEGIPYCGVDRARPLRVMVGTLHSDENEHDACIASVRKQTYRHVQHEVFSGLGKKESIATLMTTFQRSDCDLLVKVDADMVLLAPDFVERVVRVFQASPDVDLLCVAILDFFSGGPIQGINAYRKTAAWSADRQDSLFTDKTQVPSSRRLVVWSTFVRDAVHAPNPSPFQAFHFGVHRGIKTLQPGGRAHEAARAEEQLVYLEKTWAHFQLRRDLRLALACLGFELALTGRYRLEDLDYTNPALRESFASLEELDVDAVEARVLELRARRVESDDVQTIRDRRDALLDQHRAPVETIVALLPHTKVFGGVNRFFELARQFARLGVRFVIAQPDTREAIASPERVDYPDVEVRFYSEVIDEEWDVVLCGDAFGGVMLTMPLFRARLAAVYLLNGWGRSPLNLAQIALVRPDVILANSSYAAAQYAGLAPAVVPGGVDLEMFHPPERARPREARARAERLRVCAYPGRRKPSKRFEDTLDACRMLHEHGVPVELHAFDQAPLWIDVPFPFVFHGALEKERVRDLYWDVDVMVCAEEDGGWSNPAAEAMACGTPVVCTDAGTIDFAIDGETALVVPRRDAAAIAGAIERLSRDPALAERLRAAGLAKIRGFGWPQVARGLLDALGECRLDGDARALQNARAIEQLRAVGSAPSRGGR